MKKEDDVVYKNKDFTIKMQVPKEGETNSIYGFVSNVVEFDNHYLVTVNHVVHFEVDKDYEKIQTIKSKMFECGIFVLTFKSFEENYGWRCDAKTIIFGKSETASC